MKSPRAVLRRVPNEMPMKDFLLNNQLLLHEVQFKGMNNCFQNRKIDLSNKNQTIIM